MPASLDGVRAKLNRAEQHLDEFNVAFGAGLSPTRVQLRSKERDAKGNHEAIGDIFPGEPPPGLGVHLGDAVHNTRCALDHLVCQLAIAAGNPAACDRTQFPIFVDETPDNRKTIQRRIKGLSPAAQAEIERLQPYQRRPADSSGDLLWMLSELDNIDKHRLLIVINPKFATLQLSVTIDGETKSYPVSKDPGWSPLKLDAVPFRITIPNDPSKPKTDVTVKAEQMTGVVFAKTGMKGCDGLEAIPLIREMIADVRDIVAGFQAKGLI
jgi:hypothetical protein